MDNSKNKELEKILIEMIEMIEKLPNNYELGEKVRKNYWKKLKDLKESL